MINNKDEEQILVVKADIIFKDGKWQGLKTDNLDYYIDLIKNNYEFKRRGDVENDPSFQQIIPYILFNFKDRYFLYRYLKQASEDRLKNDYIIGVGGHINSEDIKTDADVLEQGMMREWEEEINYKGNLLERKLVGIINDERREVEAVHLGLLYLFCGDTPDISVRETEILKGELFSIEEIKERVRDTGGWAPIVYNEYLSKIKNN
jgi:predicted NUDIX family phosphoesterase